MLHSIVTDCVNNARLRFARTRVDYVVDVPPDLQLDSYPVTLEQVISQLISNSVIHGLEAAGTGKIVLSAARDPVVRDLIHLTVDDDGTGIDPSHLPHLFDPFFTTKMGRNSGLGLNLVYRLVTQVLGGKLAVHSTKHSGTKFTLQLPERAPFEVLVGGQKM